MYGGIPCGGGILMAMAIKRQDWMKPILMLILLGTSGLLLGRLFTMVTPGGVSGMIYVFSALEVVTIVIGVWLYREHDKAFAS